MDLGNLRSRLTRARELARAVQAALERSPPSTAGKFDSLESEGKGEGSPGMLAGWTEAAPFVQFRTLRRPNPLPSVLDMRPFLGKQVVRYLPGTDLQAVPVERLLFFDLETTGLSGGAGTLAFLAGLGKFVPGPGHGELEIRQYLLSDFPGEGAFLEAILGCLEDGIILASYNGRSFDEPLLRTRYVLNRKAWPRLLHADFLHAARRLWHGRFPDCSLGTLEGLLLGRTRTLDVHGAQIPDIWFEYAKKGRHPLMCAVVEHNAADIESLAGIAAECSRLYQDPVRARDCDLRAIGAFWLGLDIAQGVMTLERAFTEGDEKAGWMLLRHYRRGSLAEDYERVLAALSPSWRSWIEKAKHAEHRSRDAEKALLAAQEARAYANRTELLESLERRRIRLERKLSLKRLREGRRGHPR